MIQYNFSQEVFVSILMSVYNGAQTLRKAIDSIIDQTYTNFEFIICDDASTDETWKILQEYKDKDSRIHIFQNPINKGLAASLNACLTQAVGNYIARQDADDISKPERLEHTLKFLIENECPYVGCGVFVFDETGVWNRRMFPQKISCHMIAKCNPFFHPTMIFQRNAILAVNGYRSVTETRRVEDYDLVMRLAAKGIIGENLQEYLYYVYEPPEAYFRHTRITRLYEIKVKWYGLHKMKAPLWDYIYLLRPLIMCFVPFRMIKFLKQIQWRKRRKKDHAL